MKRQSLFVVAALCLHTATAQPVLNDVEDFRIGSTMVGYAPVWNNQPTGPTGANVIWDFATLPLGNDTTVTEIMDPVNAPNIAAFPGASYVEKQGKANYAYVKTSGDSSLLIGFVPKEGFEMIYDDPFCFIKRPFTYLSEINDTATRHYELPGEDVNGWGTSRVIADGWGTLILPTGTYSNVLRIKFVQEFFDTFRVNKTISHSQIITYAWFDDSHASALLKLDSVLVNSDFYNDTTATAFVLKRETLGVSGVSAKNNIQAYYADSQLFITGNTQLHGAMTVTIFDISGRAIEKYNLPSQQATQSISLAHLPKDAMYIATIQTKTKEEAAAVSVRFTR